MNSLTISLSSFPVPSTTMTTEQQPPSELSASASASPGGSASLNMPAVVSGTAESVLAKLEDNLSAQQLGSGTFGSGHDTPPLPVLNRYFKAFS